MINFNSDAVVPFLWVRDEDEITIQKEIDAIKALSINAFMIESRPRTLSESDFGTEEWFKRVGKIFAYAQKLNMQVWLLDDRSFPTGSAGGKILTKYPNLKAKQLKIMAKDIYLNGVPSLVQTGLKKASNDMVLCGYLLSENNDVKLSVSQDCELCLLPNLKGKYRVVFLIITEDSPEREGYIDMLNRDSVGVLIEEVYKSHYERFKDYFGSTFMGYFSDEPRFCNGINWFYSTPVSMYDSRVGKMEVACPFSFEVLNALYKKGYNEKQLLNLFFDFDIYSAQFRVDYMNIITDKYAENFVSNLASWCNERGVNYSGHIIEDMGVHTSLGCGAGHFFKAMKGANYSAIDVVLHQIKPFYNQGKTISPVEGGLVDQNFFHYTLAKLASSSAVLSDTANGKSFCEIFGAYGWGEKISDMLYLLNHMAVRGINHFIPHAFSMNLFDTDCPPYFYGQGKNPSVDGYRQLFKYMQKLCSLDSTRSFARVAVYYNAESVWCGKDCISIDLIAKVLTENQIEFDFIDYDNLTKAQLVDSKIVKGNCEYCALIVPNGYFAPDTEEQFARFGGLIYSVGQDDILDISVKIKNGIKLPYKIIGGDKGLRSKLFVSGEIMLFNESENAVYGTLAYGNKNLFAINPINEQLVCTGYCGKIEFTLQAGQTLLISQNLDENTVKLPILEEKENVKNFEVFTKSFDGQKFDLIGEKTVDFCYNAINLDFSGWVKYSFTKEFEENEYLSVDYYGEYLKVKAFNKEEDFITSPAIIKAKSGVQTVELIVCNTLANTMKDFLSSYAEINACGMKQISILRSEN